MCGEVGTLSDFAARCGPGQGAAGARGRQTLSIGEYLDGKKTRISLVGAALMA